jgi:molecular chaperone GrpE
MANNENTEEIKKTEETVDQTAAPETAQEEAAEPKAEKTLEEKYADALAEIEELKKDKLYKAAEFDNYRKNMMKQRAELILNGGEKTIKAILPVLDDFERAIKNINTTEDFNALKEGVELIQSKLTKALEGEGLKKMDTQGQKFDTDFHEAVALVPAPTPELKGMVMDCTQTGYTLNEKVIRHAQVVVGQ